jgi:glutamyl-tRNA synthetase
MVAAVRTRFAPSPTGDLHLGGAWTALASWVLAKAAGGASVMRVEDIDTPRVAFGSAERILDDVAWLGLTWDEGPFWQSKRAARYEAALATLEAAGLTYPCDCSRAEIARVASAPHEGEETPYPGTCRDKDPAREPKRPPSVRLRVPDEEFAFDDRVCGRVVQRPSAAAGDFVLRRGDGIFAYQLVVVVDDLEMGITDVVRGADLLSSTPRQILLARLLGGGGGAPPRPRYAHVPLVVATDGARLAKRTPGASVRALRDAGVPAGEIVGELAFGLGLAASPAPARATEIARAFDASRASWRRDPWPIPERWARVAAGR